MHDWGNVCLSLSVSVCLCLSKCTMRILQRRFSSLASCTILFIAHVVLVQVCGALYEGVASFTISSPSEVWPTLSPRVLPSKGPNVRVGGSASHTREDPGNHEPHVSIQSKNF